ncbi:hypothetical protein H696_01691 [Fonticula alba]|uniref:Peptidase M12B domain-containing protein n=1 Tax=Fonticula alba TaxID=691883 RepID=A0A058ZD33_FONAL|nr:hypothetical protein H696_01691 [Fonticula alba]KCV72294.1 hypothetical protein H696_01691 [Fonticula alba]|eukprot:XP_009493872.1 hypothetical protein H696_01691 [Fonticula alba]
MDCPNVPAIVVPPSTRVVRKVVALMATLAMLLVAVFPTPGAAIPPPNTQYPDTFDNKFQPTHRLRRLAVIPTPQASHRLSRRELFHSADKDGNSPGQAPTNTPGQLTARFVVRDPRRSLHDFEDHSNPYHEAEAFTSVEVRSFPFVNSLASPLSARRVKHERRNPASTAIRQRYGDRIDISLPLDEGSLCDLQLEIDKDLIAPGFVLKAEGPNGEMVDMTDKFEHIYYRGSAKHPVLGQGSARVAIHHLDSATGTAVLEGLVDFSHAPEGSAFARRSVVHSADRSGDRLFRIQRRLTFERAALSQLPTEDYIPSSAARSSRNIPSEGDAFLSTQPEPMDGAFFRIRRKAVRTRSSAAAAAATATAEPTEQHVDEESFPAEADDTLIVSDDVSMVVFRQSDVELIPGGPVPTCGNDHHHEHASALLETPSAEEDGFMPDVQAAAQHVSHLTHNPYSLEEVRAMAPFAGCPLTPKVLYMGFASDCTYSTFRGGDVRDISEYILNNVQMANNVYEPLFHTSLGVIELSIRLSCSDQPSWNRGCMDKYDIAERLSDFSHWRGGLSSDKPETGTEAGLWHLMSRCASGNTVGIAWVNMLCQVRSFAQSSSYVSGTAVSTPTSEEWLIVAHEIGHNFGANHDCMNSDCPKGDKCCRCSEASDGCNCAQQYIMNPLSSSSQSSFSECSQRVICSRMASDRSSCLADPGGRELLNRNMCGNGIWELPEECDCGGETGCMDHPCCNSDCTLKPANRETDRRAAPKADPGMGPKVGRMATQMVILTGIRTMILTGIRTMILTDILMIALATIPMEVIQLATLTRVIRSPFLLRTTLWMAPQAITLVMASTPISTPQMGACPTATIRMFAILMKSTSSMIATKVFIRRMMATVTDTWRVEDIWMMRIIWRMAVRMPMDTSTVASWMMTISMGINWGIIIRLVSIVPMAMAIPRAVVMMRPTIQEASAPKQSPSYRRGKQQGSCSFDGNTACCQNCQIVQDPTHVCRPKAGECDVPETCRPEQYGAMCPPDLFVEDGTLCEESEIEVRIKSSSLSGDLPLFFIEASTRSTR